MSFPLRYIKYKIDKFYYPIFAFIVSVWTLPIPIVDANSGLDPSYQLGINLAILKNFQFGEDIIFTYGPLGFLSSPLIIDYNSWTLSLFFSISIHFLFIGSIFYILKNNSNKYYAYLVVILLLLIRLHIEYELAIISSILTYIILINSKQNQGHSIGFTLVGLILAISTVIKFDAFFMAICLIFTSLLACLITKKSIKYGGYMLVSYFVFLVLLWLFTGQNIINLTSYLFGGLELSSGYGEAMALESIGVLHPVLSNIHITTSLPIHNYEGLFSYIVLLMNIARSSYFQIYLACISLLVIITNIIYSLIDDNKNILTFILLNLGILFVSFKHGFTRHDVEHVLKFFQLYVLFFGLLLVITSSSKNRRTINKIENFNMSVVSLNCLYPFFNQLNKTRKFPKLTLNSVNFILVIIMLFPMLFTDPLTIIRDNTNIVQEYPSYCLAGKFLINPINFNEYVYNEKNKIKKDYPLDNNTVNCLKNGTTDVFPWDITLVWGYDLNWSPRPVFQSYSAYTSHLDNENSLHFIGDKSPDKIMYTNKSIDSRYQLFDEPSTFQNILLNYKYQNRSGNWIILNKVSSINLDNQKEYLGTTEVKIGEIAKVPNYDGYIFGYLTFDYNLFGKIMKIIYKPSPANITLLLRDGKVTQEFRFIPGTAKNGLFLSQYIDNSDDIASIFQGKLQNDIEGIVINTSSPIYYSKNIKITFFGIPKNVFNSRSN